VVINYNTVSGNLRVQNNSSTNQIIGNTVSNTLQCSGNSTTNGSGNTAKQKQGQCANY
jgi:hypothetical protein